MEPDEDGAHRAAASPSFPVSLHHTCCVLWGQAPAPSQPPAGLSLDSGGQGLWSQLTPARHVAFPLKLTACASVSPTVHRTIATASAPRVAQGTEWLKDKVLEIGGSQRTFRRLPCRSTLSPCVSPTDMNPLYLPQPPCVPLMDLLARATTVVLSRASEHRPFTQPMSFTAQNYYHTH